MYHIGFLVAFRALLRHSELVGLCVGDVEIVSDTRAILELRETAKGFTPLPYQPGKSVFAEYHGPTESLRTIMRGRAKNAPLFPNWDEARANSLIKEGAPILNLRAEANWVFHSIRHGAAATLKLHGISMSERLARGRWLSSQVCELYSALDKDD